MEHIFYEFLNQMKNPYKPSMIYDEIYYYDLSIDSNNGMMNKNHTHTHTLNKKINEPPPNLLTIQQNSHFD